MMFIYNILIQEMDNSLPRKRYTAQHSKNDEFWQSASHKAFMFYLGFMEHSAR